MRVTTGVVAAIVSLSLGVTLGASTYGSVEPIATPDVIDTSALSAQPLSVREAFAARLLECGIVSRVVPDASFDAEVERISNRLASGAPLAIQAIKEAVRCQYRDTVDRAHLLEERWAKVVLASKDAHEGITAFKEKRKPVFQGK